MGVNLDVYFTQAPVYPAIAEIQEALVPKQAAGRVRFFACTSSWLPYFPLHHYADCYVESCRMAEQLMRGLSKAEFIYAQGLTGWKLLRMKHRRAQMPPIGVNLHGMEALQEFKGGIKERLLKWVGGPIEGWLLRHADVVLSLGGKLDEIIRHVAPEAMIRHSGNGIQHEWLCDHVDEHNGLRKFVFVGRCTRRKGLHILYAAIQGISSELKCEFHLIGDIPESNRCKDGRLTYHGPVVNETEMKSFLRKMDVLVCPSLAEGVPTVVLEGMASGLAIIATDVGAASLLVNSDNGYLVAVADATALGSALTTTATMDTSALLQLRKKGLEKAQNHAWPHVAMETLKEIETFAGIKLVAKAAGG